MLAVIFLICLAASSIGAVVGAGGGVIIKPVMDLFGLLPVSVASFCSGCTVLGMSLCSLAKSKNRNEKINLKVSTILAIGAVLGGLAGKGLFEFVGVQVGNEKILGSVQSICLTIVTLGVLIYICKKEKIRSLHVENTCIVMIIGMALGMISSFLGIGGGPYNVAVLFFFFSMEAKTAAKNSLYIIIFSQLSSIIISIVTGTVPDFRWIDLLVMILGGIGGAYIGAFLSSKIKNQGVEKILKYLCFVIVLIGGYNIFKYSVL